MTTTLYRIILSATVLLSIPAHAETIAPSCGSYRDNALGITLSVPCGWKVRSPEISKDSFRFLTLEAEGFCRASQRCAITVGPRPYLVNERDNLLSWSKAFLETATEIDDSIKWAEEHSGTQEEKLVRATGPNWQLIHFRQPELVWFVEANFTPYYNPTLQKDLARVIRSIRFTSLTPRTLTDVYGVASELRPINPLHREPTVRAPLASKLASTWLSPVRNQSNGNPWPVNCNSPAHTGTANNAARYAADVATPVGTTISAAREGTVYKADTVGNMSPFGKYIVVNTGGNYHYYAHLSDVKFYITTGYTISRSGLILGYSGNTGNVTGAHLHFHIQDGSSYSAAGPVLLNGMTGFTPDEYPDPVAGCATMGR